MGMKGTRGGASEPAVVLEKKQAVLLMCRILGAYYAEKGYAVSRECGVPTLSEDKNGKVWERIGNPQRADFIAINKKRTEVVIVETKSCPADFLSDDKWPNYMRNCTKFYFAADPSTAEYIKKALENHELKDKVGVIALDVGIGYPRWKYRPRFIQMSKKHPLGVPVEELLWRMAARNSGFTWAGGLETGNAFEHREALTLEAGL